MMLANVFTKTSQERWKSTVVAAVATGLMLLFGMAVYRDIDLSFWNELPEGFLSMFGVPEGADAGGLAFGAIYSTYGALAMAGVAIAAGSASIAGEEKNGTIGLLVGNPVSRTKVLLSKAAALFVVTLVGVAILWVAGIVTPAALNVELGTMDVNALIVMMLFNTLFYGYLAMGLSALTGKTSVASGVSSAVLIIGMIAVGLLPMVERFADLARVFPWYYYTNGDPLNKGIPWGDALILVALSVALIALGVFGLVRRDLRGQSVGTKLIDRLREHPLTAKAADMLAGTARVSKVWIKTASEYQGLLYVIVPSIFIMMLIMGPMFNLLEDSLQTMTAQMPENLLALFGGGDLSTPEGWYQIEMFGLMVPICVLVVTIAIGSGALAGEEKRNTMGLLLANPVKRTTIVMQKTVTMVIYALIVGVATILGTAAGSMLGSLGLSIGNFAMTTVLAVLIGLAFGGLALALGGATGRTGVATYGAIGLATVTYLMNGFLPLNESTEAWAKLSPFYYYLGSDPLNNGMAWGHAAVLAGLFVIGVAVAVMAFNRRDLRTKG